MRKNSLPAIVAITGLVILLSACGEIAPIFSNTPYIELRDFRITSSSPIEGDSMVITLFFRDGDGDLGIFEKGNNTSNNPDFDFFANAYKIFERREIPVRPSRGKAVSYNGQIPRLKNDDKPGPIEGTLDYRIFIVPGEDLEREFDIQQNDTIFFWIRVKDRAGNFSDSVRTNNLVVLKK